MFAFEMMFLGPVYLLAIAIPLARIDIREHRLPNRLVLPAFPIALAGQLLVDWQLGMWGLTLVALATSAIAFGAALLINRTGVLGMGDVKLIAAIAFVLGWFSPVAPVQALFYALVAATVVVLAMLVLRKTHLKAHIPFGPYLMFGFAVACLQLLYTPIDG